ncbi:hypothetical protein Tco_0305256 [Tanacetum coccineum]
MAILQPWQMYSLSSIAYISEPHFTTEFVGDVTLWSDTGLKCGVYTCIRVIDSDGLNGIVFSAEDKFTYLRHPIPAAHVPALGQQLPPDAIVAHNRWLKAFKEIACLMLYLAELMKKKKQAQGASTSGIFTMVPGMRMQVPTSNKRSKRPRMKEKMLRELYYFANKSWVYDIGCGTYICNTTQRLRGSKKLKPGALNLYVGNGPSVEAIRSFHLYLPSGLVIVLDNCHYAPSITKGIITVSCLCDNGIPQERNTITIDKTIVIQMRK